MSSLVAHSRNTSRPKISRMRLVAQRSTTRLTKKEAAMKMLQLTIDKMSQGIAEATTEVEALAESYAKLSLSGSFARQVKESVWLVELILENMQGNGTDAGTIGVIEPSLNRMKGKLRVVEDAAVQTKVSRFNYLKMVVSNGISRLRPSS